MSIRATYIGFPHDALQRGRRSMAAVILTMSDAMDLEDVMLQRGRRSMAAVMASPKSIRQSIGSLQRGRRSMAAVISTTTARSRR